MDSGPSLWWCRIVTGSVCAPTVKLSWWCFSFYFSFFFFFLERGRRTCDFCRREFTGNLSFCRKKKKTLKSCDRCERLRGTDPAFHTDLPSYCLLPAVPSDDLCWWILWGLRRIAGVLLLCYQLARKRCFIVLRNRTNIPQLTQMWRGSWCSSGSLDLFQIRLWKLANNESRHLKQQVWKTTIASCLLIFHPIKNWLIIDIFVSE